MTALTFEDYRNVLTLAKQKNPLWTTVSRDRCIAANLITRDGKITEAGEKKGLKLDYVLTKLQKGFPLSIRTVNRADELWKEEWIKVKVDANYEYAVSACALFLDIRSIDLPGTYFEQNQIKLLKKEIDISLNAKAWYKLEPFAGQLDQVGGLECICLRPVTLQDKIHRIQSKYYDFAYKIYSQPTFWYREPTPVSPNPPIAVKYDFGAQRCRSRKGLNNGIVALIMAVTGNWPVPLGVCDE